MLKHEFTAMTEADLPNLVPGQWLMNRALKFVKFLRHDGPPGNLIWCSGVFLTVPNSDVDIQEEIPHTAEPPLEVLYSIKTLSKII